MAAAVRRGADGRLPGAVGDRDAGGAGARVALGAGEEKRLSEKPTQNLAAYDAFLKGEEVWNMNADRSAKPAEALGHYEQAVALDPGFARPGRGSRGQLDPVLQQRA